jgi:hypothetical protein
MNEHPDEKVRKVAASEEEMLKVLRKAQHLVVRYPFAAQALFASLLREGRRFAQTPEGQEWKLRLEGSPLAVRGKAVFEALTLNVLEDDEDAVLPSKLLEALLWATNQRPLEQTLSALFHTETAT